MSTAQASSLSREQEQPPCFTLWAVSQTLLLYIFSPLLSKSNWPSQHTAEHRAPHLCCALLALLQATLTVSN